VLVNAENRSEPSRGLAGGLPGRTSSVCEAGAATKDPLRLRSDAIFCANKEQVGHGGDTPDKATHNSHQAARMSSLINFLNPKLKPSVESDAVCEDGYTAANLVADDIEQLERGFMCFAVCKPPIEIVFDFPKAVDMKVIKLWPSCGALRSTAFELHGRHDGIWERVAFVRDLGRGVDSVTFCYQSDYNSRSSSNSEQSEKVFFFKSAHKILASTNSVKVVIRATERCPPVLRKVQMWGLPARSLDKADRELVKTIWSEISDPYGQRDAAQTPTGQRSPPRHVPELREQSTLSIPEEFLDSITWELMVRSP